MEAKCETEGDEPFLRFGGYKTDNQNSASFENIPLTMLALPEPECIESQRS